MSDTITEQLNKLYDSQLASKKEQLTQVYDQNVSNLDAQKEEAAKQTQKNLTRTAVESQQAQKNYAEIQNAYGLSSGAMSQARLAQDNQLQADLTALRAAQQNTDDNIERQRTLLAKEYTSAIAEAQAANDLARAQALYAEAKEQDDKLNAQKEAAAQLMASAGDFSLYANLYGLTPEQVAALERVYGGNGGSSGSSGSSSGGSSIGSSGSSSNSTVADTATVVGALKDKLNSGTGSAPSEGSESANNPGTTLADRIANGMQPVQDLVQYTQDLAAALRPAGSNSAGASTTQSSSTGTTTKPTYNSIAQDVRAAKAAGKGSQDISQFINSAVAAGYITQNQAQSLRKQYLS